MVAIGYTLVYGVLRLINFAHSEVLMSGGFAGYYFLHYTMESTNVSTAMRVLILIGAVVASGAVGAIVAIGIERFAYRPLRPTQRAQAHLSDLGHRRLLLPLELRR